MAKESLTRCFWQKYKTTTSFITIYFHFANAQSKVSQQRSNNFMQTDKIPISPLYSGNNSYADSVAPARHRLT